MFTKEQQEFYEKNGYIILKNVIKPSDLETLSQEYDELFSTKHDDNLEATWGGDWKADKDKGLQVFSIHNLQMHSAAFTKLLLNEDILDACEATMGSHNIILHHTKAHVKPPGKGSPFPMHQDYHYFPYKNDSMIACFICLDASDRENGGLAIMPGSHKLGPQEDVSTHPGYHFLDKDKFPIENAEEVKNEKGDVIIFSYLTIHGSYDNLSDRTRRMYLIQFASADDEALNDFHVSPGRGTMLRGRNAKLTAGFHRDGDKK